MKPTVVGFQLRDRETSEVFDICNECAGQYGRGGYSILDSLTERAMQTRDRIRECRHCTIDLADVFI
jgi:hypothetical protein